MMNWDNFFIAEAGAAPILRTTPPAYKRPARINFCLIQVVVLPFIVAGIFMLSIGERGIYLLVTGILFSFSEAIADTWVLPLKSIADKRLI